VSPPIGPGDSESPLRIEILDADVVAVYRGMTPAERLSAAFETSELLRSLVRGRVRDLHPEWSEAKVERAVAERFRGGAE